MRFWREGDACHVLTCLFNRFLHHRTNALYHYLLRATSLDKFIYYSNSLPSNDPAIPKATYLYLILVNSNQSHTCRERKHEAKLTGYFPTT